MYDKDMNCWKSFSNYLSLYLWSYNVVLSSYLNLQSSTKYCVEEVYQPLLVLVIVLLTGIANNINQLADQKRKPHRAHRSRSHLALPALQRSVPDHLGPTLSAVPVRGLERVLHSHQDVLPRAGRGHLRRASRRPDSWNNF